MKIPVLYVAGNSNYWQMPGADCWDENRDASRYFGSLPIISHPPCRTFSRLRAFSTAPKTERFHGYRSVGLVRKYGGVVENPLSSLLWSHCQVGKPHAPDAWGGYLISVNLSWFGFPARKPTGLYICGLPYNRLPPLPLSFNAITKVVASSSGSRGMELAKNQRSITPPQMCEWLLQVARLTLVYYCSDNSKSSQLCKS